MATVRDHPDLLYPDNETLLPWQPDNIRGILKIWRDGSLTGTGTAIGALLASAMGMGKCAISIIAANTFGLERVLVICPKAAIPDWIRELRRWHTRHPLIRELGARKRWIDIPVGWVLVNYANIDRFPELKEREWDLLIIDESQAVKEPTTKRTNFIFGGEWKGKPVQPIPCRKALLVTGTPLKNRPEELFTQLHFLDPQRWPDRNTFIDRYYPEHRQVTNRGRVIQNVEPCNLAALGNELAMTVLVRANKDIAGLPPKHFEQVLIPPFDLPLQDIIWFDSVTRQMFLTGIKLKDLRVSAIACTHPKIKAHLWAEVQRLEDEIHELGAAVRCHVGDIKAPAVLSYLLTLTEKTLVICHHLHILAQLEQALTRAGKGVVVHSGQHDSPTHAVKAFQEDPNVQFFIGQALAASLSLTLTAAHHVVFAEMPPTRADFDQAVDRLHRIGQQRDVLVTVFTIDYFGSGDPALLHQMCKKKTVADTILDLKEEMVTANNTPLSGGGWDWRARWVWRDGRIASHDQAYEDELAEWYWARLGAALGDDFGLGSLFDRIDKRKLSKKDKVKQIIQALLNKTEKRGATKDEAVAAQSKAKELMAKYGVREGELLREVT